MVAEKDALAMHWDDSGNKSSRSQWDKTTKTKQLEGESSENGDKKTPCFRQGVFRKEGIGDGLLSHQVALAVPSALRSLTAVFGMGTGVAFSLLPPKNYMSKLRQLS